MLKLKNIAAFALVAAVSIAAAGNGATIFRAKLTGQGKGSAKYVIKGAPKKQKAELEVEAEKLAKKANYTIQIGSEAPIQATTNAWGAFNVEIKYTGPTRPDIKAATPIKVTDSTGLVILSGTFK